MPILFRTGSFLLLLVVAGCGSPSRSEPVARLQGNVTINGRPLPADAAGSVTFKSRERGQAPPATAKIKDGHYQTDRAPLGDVTAIFHINRPTGKIVKDSPTDAHPHPELQDLVPEDLHDGVPANVTGDNPHLDFDLRD